MTGSILHLEEQHRQDILDHLIRLDPDSRFSRFFLYMSDDAMARHAGSIDFTRDVLLGYVVDGVIRGLGYLAVQVSDVAELAFSIEADYRRHGVGLSLMSAAITEAQRIGIMHLSFSTQPANLGMAALGKKLGFKISRTEDGLNGHLDLARPSPAGAAA